VGRVTAPDQRVEQRSVAYIDLGYDNQKDVYAYARKDGNGVPVIALNLNSGAPVTVRGGTFNLKLRPRWGVLLTGK
jgi:hypothetical protein